LRPDAGRPRAYDFLNRDSELEHLDKLMGDVRAGHSAALVLRGEPGVGKSALLRYAAREASGFR
jgi:predicted ATPase